MSSFFTKIKQAALKAEDDKTNNTSSSSVLAKDIAATKSNTFGSNITNLVGLDKILTPKTGKSPFFFGITSGGNGANSLKEDVMEIDTVITGVTAVQEEFIKSLDSRFFENEFDSVTFALEKLESVKEADVNREKRLEEQTLDAINVKLTQLVMETSDSFVKGLVMIHEMKTDLEVTTKVCQNGRKRLDNAKQGIAQEGFLVLSKWKSKKKYAEMISLVSDIVKLVKNVSMMRQNLEVGRFVDAIDLCSQCHKDISGLRELKCVQSSYSQILGESYETIENAMESTLLASIKSFDVAKYDQAILGYRLLGKSTRISELQLSYFTELMHNSCQECLSNYLAEKEPDPVKNASKLEKLKKSPFKELCTLLDGELQFRQCLAILCSNIYETMCQYHGFIEWFQGQEKIVPSDLLSFYTDTRSKLERNKKILWEDMQRKIGVYFASKNLTDFLFESFMEVLKNTVQLINVGEEFLPSSSPILKNLIRQISLSYYGNFHNKRMDELLTLLPNEIWKTCPVPPNFSILHLSEFQFLTNTCTGNINDGEGQSQITLVTGLKPTSNPFTKAKKTLTETNDKMPVIRKPLIDASTKSLASSELLLATTTYSLVKNIGRYLRINENLGTISSEILIGLMQYIELYVYAVYIYFTSDIKLSDSGVPFIISARTKAAISRLKETYGDPNPTDLTSQILSSNPLSGNSSSTASGNNSNKRMRLSPMSKQVQINSPATLFGLYERIVAIESLKFVRVCLREISSRHSATRSSMHNLASSDVVVNSNSSLNEKSLNDGNIDIFNNFMAQICDVITDFRNLTLGMTSRKLVNIEPILTQMQSSSKWETKELGTAHNPYIDLLLREYQQFSSRLASLGRDLFPRDTYQALWENMIKYVMTFMIEGFSRVKKCTNEGRASMQLDTKVLQNGLEKMTDLRPLPLLNTVNEFIKAFYLDENDLESWIRSNREAFSSKQLISIINLVIVAAGGVGTSGNNVVSSLTSSGPSALARKMKLKLGPLLEDLEKQAKQ